MGQLVQLNDPLNASLLARLRGDVSMDEARRVTTRLYQTLVRQVLADLGPTVRAEVVTSTGSTWSGTIIDKAVPIVVCNIVRGGVLPSNVALDDIAMYGYANARMDCMMMNRHAGPDGHVDDIVVQGMKLGKSIGGALTLFTDGILATGGSLFKARKIYEDYGDAHQHVVIPLVCAPEGVRHMMEMFPDTYIYTIAVDDRLNDHDYVEPGVGDFGTKTNGPSDFHILMG